MTWLRCTQMTLALLLVQVFAAAGQDYPSKPVRMYTTNAGSGGDFITRQIAQGISGPLGQPVVVDNRPALIAPDVVAKAPADGYALLVVGGSMLTTPLLQKAPFDAQRDFAPVTLAASAPFVVAVHPSLPVKSIKELIALAKSRPGELNYAAGTAGASTHLWSELFRSMAGIKIVHVRYKGPAPSVTALISGEVQMTINDVGLLMPHAKTGKLHILAVTSAQPSALTPGLPTVAATGLPGYEAVGITGVWVPIKTQPAIVNRLNQEIVRVLKTPEVKERFLNAGAETAGNSPEQFGSIIKAEIAKISKVIKDAGIRSEE